ncbi:phospho-N-acetylmuramoyl-pentapeptide-transferase [Clostridium sediminicola]|uniref:phospho-N-acetylmuramoyl-pentapeptide- transferase n=1 Tax=Clostridium sediminicola TaxID=3114879 RepID=UPI0031F27351
MNLVIYSVIVAFILALLLGPLVIPMLHKLKFGQNIREEGPKSHQKKSGTPTMGGIIFIVSSVVSVLIIDRNLSTTSVAIIFAILAFGGIGFLDDYLNIVRKKNEGLKPKQKMLLLLIASTILAVFAYKSPEIGSSIIIPFAKIQIDLGIVYIPFIVLYFSAATNAVNLTDGLDGLSTTITTLVMTFFASVALSLGNMQVALFCGALAGALLGFLHFNAYPAKVFMGDTGSLALGGALGAIAMVLKLPLLVIIVGGVYVAETLSVIIQVISFKTTGKRVFKMSPLHHHFELCGWHETRVVVVFSIVTIILCLIGFLSIM